MFSSGMGFKNTQLLFKYCGQKVKQKYGATQNAAIHSLYHFNRQHSDMLLWKIRNTNWQ
jgi:hypothetical protein